MLRDGLSRLRILWRSALVLRFTLWRLALLWITLRRGALLWLALWRTALLRLALWRADAVLRPPGLRLPAVLLSSHGIRWGMR